MWIKYFIGGVDMKPKIISIIIISTFVSGLFSCATIEEHKGAATGAAVGAATGAIAGAILGKEGHKTEVAIIGGLLGGLIGGAVGHYAYDVKRTREETAQRYNYQSSSGTMIRIEEASAIPNTVQPGDKVELKMTYAVLGVDPHKAIDITEIREIRHEGELVGKPEVNVAHAGGTYSSSIPIFMPSNAKRGRYNVIMTVQAQMAKDSKETNFYVR